MKVEQILDEMQAFLTKLRGHCRKTETGRVCVGTCGGKAREGSNYCQSCMDTRILDTVGERLTGTAGECKPRGFHESPTVSGIIKEAIPDPLHVRVAKALGKKVIHWGDTSKKWFFDSDTHKTLDLECPIPDYPNDLVAAMGALEEYCRESNLNWSCSIFRDVYYCDIRKDDNGIPIHVSNGISISLPQAICEAIVKYAEQK